MNYRYILRYYIDPGFHEEARIVELVNFCLESKIAEVMLLHNPEELFQGYPLSDEIDDWFRLALKVKDALAAENIVFSINPWTTTAHLSRGRRFGEAQQNFQPMVGETGTLSPITACPFDQNWQQQLSNFFSRIARDIAPTTIWVEDDWRLHNHEPEMNFGGCFCPLHLKRFEEKTGIRTDRETLLAKVTAPGTPHPWRRPWLDVCRDSLLEPAQVLREAVSQANPDVKLGLMSSVPDVHSAEGRDWLRLKDALSPAFPMPLRPHLPPYTQIHALQCFPAIPRQTAAEFPTCEVVIYPELENSPRSGPYSKSTAFSGWEILTSPMYGSAGITINHYDMMGNGIALDPHFGLMLATIKPRLDAIVGLGAAEANAVGPDVLFRPDVAVAVTTKREGSMQGLINRSVEWSRVFGILGISHRLTRSWDPARLTAVSGETLRAFSDAELTAMLGRNLLLDADSVEILVERGFGAYIGVSECRFVAAMEAGFAFETVESDDEVDYGIRRSRMCAQRDGAYLRMCPTGDVEILSTIRKYDRSILFPGTLNFRNGIGGSITSICHRLGDAQFYMSFFNVFRRTLIQRVITANTPQAVFGLDRPLNLYCNRIGDGAVLMAIANPTDDAVRRPRIAFHGIDPKRVVCLDANGKWQPVKLDMLPEIPALEVIYLKFMEA